MDSIQIKKIKKKEVTRTWVWRYERLSKRPHKVRQKNKSPFDWEKGGERKEEEI